MNVAREWWRRSPMMAALAVAHLILLAGLLAAVSLDDAQVLGINRWIKPAKFAASIALYLATLAWYAPVLGDSKGKRRAFVLIAIGMVVEQVAITIQGARGTTSHYNIGTRLDAGLFQAMGIWIAINTVAAGYCGWLALRAFRGTGETHALAVTLGFTVFLAGSAIGAVMIGHTGHTVGAPDGGPGLLFVNWSTVAGDLRVSHFVGLHALQLLPVMAAAAGRRALWGATVAWLLVTALTLAQAVAGRPLWAVRG